MPVAVAVAVAVVETVAVVVVVAVVVAAVVAVLSPLPAVALLLIPVVVVVGRVSLAPADSLASEAVVPEHPHSPDTAPDHNIRASVRARTGETQR